MDHNCTMVKCPMAIVQLANQYKIDGWNDILLYNFVLFSFCPTDKNLLYFFIYSNIFPPGHLCDRAILYTAGSQ